MTLLEFLEARLAEDEAGARAATPGPWTLADEPEASPDEAPAADAERIANRRQVRATNEHTVRWHPARVLAEVEAKRDLIDLVLGYEAGIDGEFGCCHKADEIAEGECPETPVDDIEGLQVLAAPYAGHVDYLPEWAVVPRS